MDAKDRARTGCPSEGAYSGVKGEMSNEPINAVVSEAIEPAANPYLERAKLYENAAETYREVRLFGPATDAEAWKGACVFLSMLIVQRDELAA